MARQSLVSKLNLLSSHPLTELFSIEWPFCMRFAHRTSFVKYILVYFCSICIIIFDNDNLNASIFGWLIFFDGAKNPINFY